MNKDYLDFISELNDFVREEEKNQAKKPKEKFEIPSYFIKTKDKPVLQDVKMNLDSDGQVLKRWILRKVKKEQVFIKNEYMDYAIEHNISKAKAERLLQEITQTLGLVKDWKVNFLESQYPALKRTYSNAVFYKLSPYGLLA